MFHKHRITIAILLSTLLLLSVGCATIEGAGKDIEAAGEKIQESAEDANE